MWSCAASSFVLYFWMKAQMKAQICCCVVVSLPASWKYASNSAQNKSLLKGILGLFTRACLMQRLLVMKALDLIVH